MSEQFNLMCEYIHCFGKHSFSVGSVESENEANIWLAKHKQSAFRPSLPADDPIRTCPVARCPFKKQIPRLSIRMT